MTRIELWNLHNTDKTVDLFYNLYTRWQDEKEYEDINEYLKVIQKSIPEAIKITKRPFSVMCKCDNGVIQIGIKRNGKYMQMFANMVK